jgi:hypothetical protein
MVTFHPEAVTRECQQVLQLLCREPMLADFYLAGGTALALQIGHRISTDLDWFTSVRRLEQPEREQLRAALSRHTPLQVITEQDGQLCARIGNADTSFIYQQHRLLEPVLDYNGVRLASPTDIGLMKLAAINSRGTRRDFVDLYCLRKLTSLEQLLLLAEVKYADRPSFLDIAARALVYFVDAEQQPMPRMLWKDVEWTDIVQYCQQAAKWLVNRLREKNR